MRPIVLISGLLLSLPFAGAVETTLPEKASQRQAPLSKHPLLKLEIGVNDVYGKESACSCVPSATRTYGDFCRILKEDYAIELILHHFVESYALTGEYRGGQLDGFLCKPWLVYQKQGGRKMVRLADLQDPSGNTQLWGMLLVKRESRIRSPKELKDRRIALGQEDAFETHQGARKMLEGFGLSVSTKNTVEKASGLECIDLLLKGEVDAAVVSNYTLVADCAVDFTRPEDFRVLAETEKIPLTSLMVDAGKIKEEEILRLKQALLELSKKKLPASMSGGGFVLPSQWDVTVSTTKNK